MRLGLGVEIDTLTNQIGGCNRTGVYSYIMYVVYVAVSLCRCV